MSKSKSKVSNSTMRLSLLLLSIAMLVSSTGCFRCLRRCGYVGPATCGVADCGAPSCGCADDGCEASCGCDDVSCDDVGCGDCVGNGSGCCLWLKRLFGRLGGCSGCDSEIYWSEWHNNPPGCETCDCNGNWTGQPGGYRAPYRHQPILAVKQAVGDDVVELAEESDTVFR